MMALTWRSTAGTMAQRHVMSAASVWLSLGIVLMCLGPLVPLHLPPWPSFHAEAVSVFGFGLVCVACLVQGGAIRWPLLCLLTLSTACVPLLQAATGLIYFQGDAWLAVTYLLWFSLAMAAGATIRVDGIRTSELAAGAVLVGALLSVAIGTCQWLELRPMGDWMTNMRSGSRPFGNLGQPNQFATWLTFGVLSAHWLYQRRRLGMAALLIVTAFLAFGQAMSQSRAGMLEILVVAAFALALHRRAHLGRSTAVLCGNVLMLLALSYGWTQINELLLLSPSRSLEHDVSGQLRLTHWATLLDAISRQPWFGYGYGQVSVAQAAAAADHAATGELIEHSHNIVLDLLAWNGIPLGTALIALFAAWLVRSVARCRTVQSALALAAVIAMLVHGCLEYPLEYSYFLLPLGLLIGALTRDYPSRWDLTISRRVSAFVFFVAAALTLWVAAEYMVIEESYRSIRLEMAGFTRGDLPGTPPDVMLLTHRRELLRYARVTSHREMTASELEWMRHVSARFGTPPVLLRVAVAEGLNGHPEAAGHALAVLCKTGTPDRCHEGIEAWKTMSAAQYPELATVKLPPEAPRNIAVSRRSGHGEQNRPR